MSEDQPTSALIVPDMMLKVAENLREKNHALLKRLSWHDLRIITEPMVDHIATLELEKVALLAERASLEGMIKQLSGGIESLLRQRVES